MSDIVVRVGSHSEQGVRPNNEDRFAIDLDNRLFVVADGMGGQERGEMASGMAVDIIPKIVGSRLAQQLDANQAVQAAIHEANHAIIDAGRHQPAGRRMGTTAVLALHHNHTCYVAGIGDSRAYLIRGEQVEQLTVDHSVAQALVLSGALTPEEARHSPYQHVLHKFLGCTNMTDGADIRPFTPEPGDRLLLGSDGLTNHVTDADMLAGARRYADPQEWAAHLVQTALSRGSKDNATCVVVAFDPA
jgi:serine/threonine protein phosphatase PrpC